LPFKGKEFFKTAGFKELAYFEGACNSSYRLTTKLLNRVQHQKDASSYRTLDSGVEQEARAISIKMNDIATQVLDKHNFTKTACPIEASNYEKIKFHAMDTQKLNINLDVLKTEVSEDLAKILNTGNVAFEEVENTVNISIDDVGAKKQKLQRNLKTKNKIDTKETESTDVLKVEEEKKKREYVYNTVVHIGYQRGHYTLIGLGVNSIINLLIAFLLHNELLTKNLIFFLDGQRTLYTTLLKCLCWRGKLTFILDWYHLKKKCEMQLSMGLNNRQKRNEILGKILYYSWYGLIDKVNEIIDKIPNEYIKNQDALEKLKGYYERNYNYIPNYALRKKLKLRNSSNRGEKENDLIIAARQKHNGMAWSKTGSNSLGILNAIKRNKEMNNWLNKNEILFKIVD